MPDTPTISVIIPSGDASRDRNLELLRQDLQSQSLQPNEIEIVRGVSPNGRARNMGVERTTGEILVFLDDDVRLGTPHILRDLVHYLQADPHLGIVAPLNSCHPMPLASSAFVPGKSPAANRPSCTNLRTVTW